MGMRPPTMAIVVVLAGSLGGCANAGSAAACPAPVLEVSDPTVAPGDGIEIEGRYFFQSCDDVDTGDDLRRVGLRAGPRTQAAIASLGLAA